MSRRIFGMCPYLASHSGVTLGVAYGVDVLDV